MTSVEGRTINAREGRFLSKRSGPCTWNASPRWSP